MPVADLTGQRFGRLVAVSREGFDKHRNVLWLCRCDCGNTKITSGAQMKTGQTRSCGCLRQDWMEGHKVRLAERSRTHGMTKTPEFRVWQNMKDRCHNPNSTRFGYYGARGITVCDEWRASFEAFYAHMGPRPGERLSIDRIDNDLGYFPGNCRWATAVEQRHNRRDSPKYQV